MRSLIVVFLALTAVAVGGVSGNGLGDVSKLMLPVAPGELILHESLFQKITSAMLPIIIEAARKTSIPGESQKHFKYGTIVLSEFNIGSFTIGFEAPNSIVISLLDLSMAVPHTSFEVMDTIVWVHVHCSGTFWASLSKTNIVIRASLGRSSTGGIEVTGVTDSVVFGQLSVGHRFNHELCRIANDIINALIGNINEKIEELVKSDIGPVIAKTVDAALSKAAAEIKIQLITAPKATTDSITFYVNVLSLLGSEAVPPRGAPRLVAPRSSALVRALPPRDVAVSITDASANTLFAYADSMGYFKHTAKTHYTTAFFKTLLPKAYALCPDCKMQLPWDLPRAPVMTFNGGVSFSVTDAQITIDALRPNGTAIPILTLQGNLTGVATNFSTSGGNSSVLHLAVAVPTLRFAFIHSAIGYINATVLNAVSDFAVRDVIVPGINLLLSTQGIPIPPMAGITPADVAVDFVAGLAYCGLNIIV